MSPKRPPELINPGSQNEIVCIEFNPFLKIQGWRESRCETPFILVDTFTSRKSQSFFRNSDITIDDLEISPPKEKFSHRKLKFIVNLEIHTNW